MIKRDITNPRRDLPLTLAVFRLGTLLTVPLAWAGVEPTPFRTGLFGVIAGQSIRISILNADHAGGIIGPCFHLWDVTGRLVIDHSAGALPKGSATFADFRPIPDDGSPPAGTLRGAGRRQLRAEVVFSHDPAPPDRETPAARGLQQGILVTREVLDAATGRTIFTVPFTAVGFNPQPEPPEPIREPA